MTAHTKIESPIAQLCREHMANLEAWEARRGCKDRKLWSRHYVASRYSVADWLTACQEAIDENDFAHVTDMMERDGWDMDGLTDEVGTIDQRVPPIGGVL